METPQLPNNAYAVGWICAIETEYTAARAFLDEEHQIPEYVAPNDNNVYTLGKIGRHNVVIAVAAEYGTTSAATVARDMLHSFINVRIGLMVGVGGGAPTKQHDIRLGDVVVSEPTKAGQGCIFEYDYGKSIQKEKFEVTRILDQPPILLRKATEDLRSRYKSDGHQIQQAIKAALANKPRLKKSHTQPQSSTDRLYLSTTIHAKGEEDCAAACSADPAVLVPREPRGEDDDDPVIHHGCIASGNRVVKDAEYRDELARTQDILCFEMEAAGLMNHFPCLVIRGICDYADTHKNKAWQGYAAMTAAAYAKDLLGRIPPNRVEAEKPARELLEMNEKLIVLQKKAEGEETDRRLQKIQAWLSAPDPSNNLNKAREQRHQGTGQWFLDSEEYMKWKTDRNSFLWLNGIPGCGKTVLSSSVVADLEQDAMSRRPLYFYFDFNDVEKQSTDKAIRSLVLQLYHIRKELRRDVDSLYTDHGDGLRQPDSASLSKLFESMVQQAGEVWLVLDALDECTGQNDGATSGLLLWISNLRNADLNVHILVTSRPQEDIKTAIGGWAQATEIVPLQSSRISDDINSFIKAKTKAMPRWQSRPDIHEEIETTLIEKANGMFRWVSCQIDILKGCLDPISLRKELVNLPRTLEATYARILRNIPPGQMESAKRLLQFLTYSERPLRVEEAVDVVAVDLSHIDQRPFHSSHRMPDPQEVAMYCSSLVISTTRKGSGGEVTEIQLAHFSVREYLVSARVDESVAQELGEVNARAAIVEVCLSYLIDLEHSYDKEEEKQRQPLVQYSARYWPTHAAVVEASLKAVAPKVEEYLLSDVAYRFGYRVYPLDQPWKYSDDPVPPLYYVSFAGLLHSVQLILNTGADVNEQGGYYNNALQAASAGGHKEVVELLLNHGADQKLKGGKYSYALQAASVKGHEDIAQLLLLHGADVNAQDEDEGSALYMASLGGHEKLVSLLLEGGANVNAKGGNFGNALQAACFRGDEEVVKLLLAKEANVNAEGGQYGSALQAASAEGREKVVELLLKANAGPARAKATALHMACFEGHEAVVRLLLASGADVNAKGEDFDNALQAASSGGEENIVQLLRSSANRKRPTD